MSTILDNFLTDIQQLTAKLNKTTAQRDKLLAACKSLVNGKDTHLFEVEVEVDTVDYENMLLAEDALSLAIASCNDFWEAAREAIKEVEEAE